MASTEMIQMCRQTLNSTPKAMQIASTAPSDPSMKSPILQAPSPPVTLEQLLLKLIQYKNLARASSGIKLDTKCVASMMEFITVTEVWDEYKYKVMKGVRVRGKTSLLLSTKHLYLLNLLIDYIKNTYTPTTKTLGVRLLLGKDKDNTPLWAQKELLLKRKDDDPNSLDSGKFDPPELPAITWPEFEPAELPAITWPDFEPAEFFEPELAITLPDFEPADITWSDFEPAELPAITWPDFEPAESAITLPYFHPAESAITLPDFEPAESAIILPYFHPAESAITLPDFEPAAITWPDFEPAESQGITSDFKPQELPEITWDFEPQELPDITWDFKPQDVEFEWDKVIPAQHDILIEFEWEIIPAQHDLVMEFEWNPTQHDQLDEIQSGNGDLSDGRVEI